MLSRCVTRKSTSEPGLLKLGCGRHSQPHHRTLPEDPVLKMKDPFGPTVDFLPTGNGRIRISKVSPVPSQPRVKILIDLGKIIALITKTQIQ